MKKYLLFAALGLGLWFDFLFWSEGWGLNILLYTLSSIPLLLWVHPEAVKSGTVKALSLGTFLLALLVMWHHTLNSCILYFISYTLLIGVLHYPYFRQPVLAIISSCLAMVYVPVGYFQEAKRWSMSNNKLSPKIMRKFKLILFPLAVLGVFFVIFKMANPKFDALTSHLFYWMGDVFDWLFSLISIGHLAFLFLAFLLTGAAVFRTPWLNLFSGERTTPEVLTRWRKRKPYNRYAHKVLVGKPLLGLKTEFRMALLTLILVNALLWLVNVIDVYWLWFAFDPAEVGNLSQLVHEGTYLLILSILLSMALLLYFFRSKLNFFPKNLWLKRLALAWIAQNVLLAVSVGVRNYHYIYEYGLAYKRIGVILFLLMVCVGLLTFYFKITHKKSAYYLVRMNTWAVYGVMVFSCFLPWDRVIVSYNLKYVAEDKMDYAFLITRSETTLPLLLEHADRWKDKEVYTGWFSYAPDNVRTYILQRAVDYQNNASSKSWKSWNYADHLALQQLKPYEAVLANFNKTINQRTHE